MLRCSKWSGFNIPHRHKVSVYIEKVSGGVNECISDTVLLFSHNLYSYGWWIYLLGGSMGICLVGRLDGLMVGWLAGWLASWLTG